MKNQQSFADFFRSENNPDQSLPPAQASFAVGAEAILFSMRSPIFSSSREDIPTDKQEKFAKKVSEITHSDDFIDKVSDQIGVPSENESEDAFVKRAKSVMRELLRSRLR